MGTRYVVTAQQFKEAGVEIVDREDTRWEEVHQPGAGAMDEGNFCYEPVTTRWKEVVIAGWAFASYLGREFVGPNRGKPEVDEALAKLGIKPHFF